MPTIVCARKSLSLTRTLIHLQTTIRAAKGLLNCGLSDPKSVKDSSIEEKIKALNSEGNVQRGMCTVV